MRDYGKVYSTFWTSQTTGGLSQDGKLLSLYLLTCSHSTIAGVFRLPDGYVAEDLGWVPQRVAEGFAELLRKGFANRCETTKWVWVKEHLKWNKPENPNQRKSAAKIAASVPHECAWFREFMRVHGPFLELPPLPSPDPCETVAATVPKPFLNQEQEQEQEQKQLNTSTAIAVVPTSAAPTPAAPPAKPKKPKREEGDPHPDDAPEGTEAGEAPPDRHAHLLPRCPQGKVRELWAQLLPDMPQHTAWTEHRKALLRVRWKQLAKENKWQGEEAGLHHFAKLFRYIGKSMFLTGRAQTQDGRRPFQATLEWVLKANNMAKIIDGDYHTEG